MHICREVDHLQAHKKKLRAWVLGAMHCYAAAYMACDQGQSAHEHSVPNVPCLLSAYLQMWQSQARKVLTSMYPPRRPHSPTKPCSDGVRQKRMTAWS